MEGRETVELRGVSSRHPSLLESIWPSINGDYPVRFYVALLNESGYYEFAKAPLKSTPSAASHQFNVELC